MNYFYFNFLDCILYNVRHHRVLPNKSTTGHNAIQHVLGYLFADFIRCAISGSRSRRCDECSERCVLGAGNVSPVPSILRIFRQFWRDSDLPTMDHLSQLHQIWFRRNHFNYLQLQSREIEVFPGRIHSDIQHSIRRRHQSWSIKNDTDYILTYFQIYCHFKNPETTLEELDMLDADFTLDVLALLLIFVVLRVAAYLFLRWKIKNAR